MRFWSALSELRRSDHHQNGRQIEVRLQGSGDWNELWRRVIAAAEDSHFRSVCLDVNAPALKEGYHARWGRVHSEESPCYWKAEIPLTAAGQFVGRLEVVGLRNGQPIGESIAEVGRLVADLEATMGDLTGFASAPNLMDSQAGRVDRPITPVFDVTGSTGAILPPRSAVLSDSTVAKPVANS